MKSAPMGWTTSEPAQMATSPASGPLCTKPGSFLPTASAASVPPDMAMSELSATRPLILSMVCADITLNPNQPTDRIQAPRARNGMLDGGWEVRTLPSPEYRPVRAPSTSTAARPIQPPTVCTTTDPAKSWNSSPKAPFTDAWKPNCWFQAMPSNSG